MLPAVAIEEGKKPTENSELCSYWQRIREYDNHKWYSMMSPTCLLSLPHSNADTERVFSVVRKKITDYSTEIEPSPGCMMKHLANSETTGIGERL